MTQDAETKQRDSGAEPSATIKSYRQRFRTYARIPAVGRDRDEILAEMEEMRSLEEARWKAGYASGSVYHGDEDHIEFLSKVYAINSQSNPLQRFPLLLDQLTALRPDVIGLQEVNLATDQGMSLCRLANDRLTDPPRYCVYHMARPGRGAHVEALAVMSRLPVEAHEGLDYLLHDGVAQRLRLRLQSGAVLDFYNTHLHFPPSATEQRLSQAKRLLAWVDTWQGGDATVIVGDFNAYPEEPTVALMKGRFTSAHEAAHGREPEKTWPTPVNTFDPSPPGCLDYVFVAGAGVLEAGLAFNTPHPSDGSLFPSDHLGVMAKVDVG